MYNIARSSINEKPTKHTKAIKTVFNAKEVEGKGNDHLPSSSFVTIVIIIYTDYCKMNNLVHNYFLSLITLSRIQV